MNGKADMPTRLAPRPDDDGIRPMIVFLCTGNAARSVMAAAMLRELQGDQPELSVTSGGTHVLPGQPMSVRTRRALARHGLRDSFHRSHQLDESDVERATLILVMEPDHLRWLRKTYPVGATKTGALPLVARDLGSGGAADLGERVAALQLESVELDAVGEVVDPGAGEQPDYDASADELAEMVAELARRLS